MPRYSLLYSEHCLTYTPRNNQLTVSIVSDIFVQILAVRCSPETAETTLAINEPAAGGLLLASIPTPLTVHRSGEYMGPRAIIVASSHEVFRQGSRVREAAQIAASGIPVRTILSSERERSWTKKPSPLPASFPFPRTVGPGVIADIAPTPVPVDDLQEGKEFFLLKLVLWFFTFKWNFLKITGTPLGRPEAHTHQYTCTFSNILNQTRCNGIRFQTL